MAVWLKEAAPTHCRQAGQSAFCPLDTLAHVQP